MKEARERFSFLTENSVNCVATMTMEITTKKTATNALTMRRSCWCKSGKEERIGSF